MQNKTMKILGRAALVAACATMLALPAIAQTSEANTPNSTDSELFPPNAKPGECYARVYVSPSYTTETERVRVRDAATKLEVIPARYEWVEERVLVKEASERLEIVPATYDWVEERMVVKPETKRLKPVAAKYNTVTEKVLDRPAHTVWKKGRNPYQKVGKDTGGEGTGEIMCLVEVPATYKTVSKRVLAEPARSEEILIPAEYKNVKRQVMKTAPTTRTITIPAEYKTVKVYKEIEPAKTRSLEIPEEYNTVTRRKMVRDGRLEWQPVLCETNANLETVRAIQRALKGAGHNPGTIDGVIGADTMSAIKNFQKSKGLPTGGLTFETIRALGVNVG